MKTVTVELPGIKAVSRNQSAGHWTNYHKQLRKAEQWMIAFGKSKEYHFENLVDVDIVAWFDTRGNKKCNDSPNIDIKIFTDILIRYKQQMKGVAIQRPVWFIEDDNPKYLRKVSALAIPSDNYKVVITITEVGDDN